MKNKQAVELLTEFKSRGITWEIKNGFVLFDTAKLNTSDIMKLAGFKNEQLISVASKV